MSQKRLRFLLLILETEKSFVQGIHRQISPLHCLCRQTRNDTTRHRSNDYLKENRTEVMFRQFKKNLVATLIAALTLSQVAPAFANSADSLPDMGTSAASTLSIGQEMQMG
ncbi:hypothetical protein FF021_21555, partial [Leptospira noguchii]